MIGAVQDQAPRAPVGVWEPNKVRSPCWFARVPPRLRWASWGRSAVRDALKLKCRRFESVRIESSVDPLQLDPKMFSAPADAAVGFSQLPGTLRPSMRALSGIGTVQASLHALCSR
jgi:hypothetical protein